MTTAIKHPVPDRVKPSFVIFDIRALWRSALKGLNMFKLISMHGHGLIDHYKRLCCTVYCDSAGVMYWGDASQNKIETANIDGTGRRTLLPETNPNPHYFAFALHAGHIYFTDWTIAYASIYIWITKYFIINIIIGCRTFVELDVSMQQNISYNSMIFLSCLWYYFIVSLTGEVYSNEFLRLS